MRPHQLRKTMKEKLLDITVNYKDKKRRKVLEIKGSSVDGSFDHAEKGGTSSPNVD
jgi:hypothetical protein